MTEASVWGETFLLINVAANTGLLWAAGRMCRRTASKWRLFIAGGVGAVYGLIVLEGMGDGFLVNSKVLVGLVLILLAYAPCPLVCFWKVAASFYGLALASGGVVLALGTWGGAVVDPVTGWIGFSPGETAVWQLAVGFGVGWWLLKILVSAKKQAESSGCCHELNIRVGERAIMIRALEDSGQELHDPVSGSPVIIVRAKAILDLLPPTVYRWCLEDKSLKRLLEYSDELPEDWLHRVRLIPYTAVGTSSGLLGGFVPDQVTRDGRALLSPTVAITEQLSSSAQRFDALVNPTTINPNVSVNSVEGWNTGISASLAEKQVR